MEEASKGWCMAKEAACNGPMEVLTDGTDLGGQTAPGSVSVAALGAVEHWGWAVPSWRSENWNAYWETEEAAWQFGPALAVLALAWNWVWPPVDIGRAAWT